jgi:hypothetical protein
VQRDALPVKWCLTAYRAVFEVLILGWFMQANV